MTEQLYNILDGKSLQEILHLRPTVPIKVSRAFLQRLDSKTLETGVKRTNSLYLLGLIYLLTLTSDQFEEQPKEFITSTLLTSLIKINSNIKGSHLANKLSYYILFIMEKIEQLQRQQGSPEHIMEIDLDEVKNEMEAYCLELGEVFSDWETKSLPGICELARLNKVEAINKYVDLLGLCSSLEEQICIYSEKSSKFFAELFKIDEEKNRKDFSQLHDPPLIVALLKFLESAVYKVVNLITVPKSLLTSSQAFLFEAVDQASEPDLMQLGDLEVKSFTINFLKDLKQKYSNFFSVTIPLVDYVLEGMIQQSSQSLKDILNNYPEALSCLFAILERLFWGFPYQQILISEKIKKFFQFTSEVEFLKGDLSIKYFNKFFQELKKIKSPMLKTFNTLQKLIIVEAEGGDAALDKTIGATPLKEINLRAGFPLSANVSAGAVYEQIIEVWIPDSIITWAFATKWYDITFELHFLGEFIDPPSGAVVLMRHERISSDQKPFRGVYFARRPGLYKLVFDNAHSWMTPKSLRYRIFILNNDERASPYAYPFYETVMNSHAEKGKEGPSSIYFHSEHRMILYLTKNALNCVGHQPNKSYEQSFELGTDLDEYLYDKSVPSKEIRRETFEEKLVESLHKTFSDDLEGYFQKEALSFLFIFQQDALQDFFEVKKEDIDSYRGVEKKTFRYPANPEPSEESIPEKKNECELNQTLSFEELSKRSHKILTLVPSLLLKLIKNFQVTTLNERDILFNKMINQLEKDKVIIAVFAESDYLMVLNPSEPHFNLAHMLIINNDGQSESILKTYIKEKDQTRRERLVMLLITNLFILSKIPIKRVVFNGFLFKDKNEAELRNTVLDMIKGIMENAESRCQGLEDYLSLMIVDRFDEEFKFEEISEWE